MDYKILTDNLDWYGLNKGDILCELDRAVGEERSWFKLQGQTNLCGGFYDLDKVYLYHPGWLSEAGTFTTSDMLSFAEFVNKRLKTKDKVLDWPQDYLKDWLNENK